MTIIDMLKTILVGMALAAPIGPISLLCIRTTIGSGFRAGFSAGLGAALADGIVCLAALFGIGIISSSPLFSGPLLSWVAAAYLVYLGGSMIFHSGKNAPAAGTADQGPAQSFVSTFVFTAINPITLLSFAALFCNRNSSENSLHTLLLTAACIALGSAIWWLILAAFMSVARSNLGKKALKAIDLGSAFCILACGIKLIFA
jgi:threonine/homoserine/homoserine lactone efflux protein